MLEQNFQVVQACKTEVASLMEAVTGAIDAASSAAAAESVRQVSAAAIVRHADLAERARCLLYSGEDAHNDLFLVMCMFHVTRGSGCVTTVCVIPLQDTMAVRPSCRQVLGMG